MSLPLLLNGLESALQADQESQTVIRYTVATCARRALLHGASYGFDTQEQAEDALHKNRPLAKALAGPSAEYLSVWKVTHTVEKLP